MGEDGLEHINLGLFAQFPEYIKLVRDQEIGGCHHIGLCDQPKENLLFPQFLLADAGQL